jgi:hypothetical protein
MSREYGSGCEPEDGSRFRFEPSNLPVDPIIPGEPESAPDLNLEAFQGPFCFTCRQHPAGFGEWYALSAYCPACQPDPDMDSIPPYGKSRKAWATQLTACLAEITTAWRTFIAVRPVHGDSGCPAP